MLFFFFFSSRRRHTRYIGDWSSDVCSSDLSAAREVGLYEANPGSYGVEEKDLCLRLLDAGYKIVKLSGVHVWHDKTEIRSEERRVGKESRNRRVRERERKKKKRIEIRKINR